MSTSIPLRSNPTIMFCDPSGSHVPGHGETAGHRARVDSDLHLFDDFATPETHMNAKFPAGECQVLMPERAGEAYRPHGVLIIEDDLLLRKSLSIGLKKQGFDVWLAADGVEGVEIYLQFCPLIDVVLSDVQMPTLDGPGALKALLKINPLIRLCFMTGDSRIAKHADLLQRGALKVYTKPFASVSEVAQDLWDLATRPLGSAIEQVPIDPKITAPDCSAVEAFTGRSEEDCTFFEWAWDTFLARFRKNLATSTSYKEDV